MKLQRIGRLTFIALALLPTGELFARGRGAPLASAPKLGAKAPAPLKSPLAGKVGVLPNAGGKINLPNKLPINRLPIGGPLQAKANVAAGLKAAAIKRKVPPLAAARARANIANRIAIARRLNHPLHPGLALRYRLHRNWYHGHWYGRWFWPGNRYWFRYWHGFWPGYWDRPWYARPWVWGLGAWAWGSTFYDSGYAVYYNPYFLPAWVTPGVCCDYSTPLQVSVRHDGTAEETEQPVDPASLSAEARTAIQHFDAARNAFKRGDYPTALKETQVALQATPKDPAIHEFRALVLFAMADYQKAAAAAYAVLSVGPGWDWTTLSSMYPSVETYTQQLRALEEYQRQHPAAAYAKFLLAYHYISCGHTDSALRMMREAAKLKPDDQLAANLVKMLESGGPDQAGAPVPEAEEDLQPSQQPAPPAVDPRRIVGTWTAKNASGTSFTLTLTPDAKFTWGYDRSGKTQQFKGTYSVDEAVLVLERSDGESMAGLVTLAQQGFNFKLFGGPPEDPGLDFKK